MNESLTRSINRRYEALGVYQLVGGVVGYALLMLFIAQVQVVSLVLLLLLLFAFFLYGYSVFCGASLLRKKQSGLFYSLINQYLQLISFDILGYSYKYVSGVSVSTGTDIADFPGFVFDVGISDWSMSINNDLRRIYFEFNWVPIFLIIALIRLGTMVEKRDTQLKIEELGT